MADIRQDILEAKKSAERKNIVEWLSKGLPDPSTEHVIARRKHKATTGDWLINCTELEDWESTENSLLWLNGGGKSTRDP